MREQLDLTTKNKNKTKQTICESSVHPEETNPINNIIVFSPNLTYDYDGT